MSCQSVPVWDRTAPHSCANLMRFVCGPGVSKGPHEMPLVPFSYAFLSLGKDTGAP
ncbi:unnamed protein product [Staurois parvus]|uniref:Uncharacterized protein n=1 Tax=Staurois parvus TaxID=386267 RepID=A0ABN9D890_9NEOB|nr:unnamed protein product [Staurois parvus]